MSTTDTNQKCPWHGRYVTENKYMYAWDMLVFMVNSLGVHIWRGWLGRGEAR